MFDYTPVAEIVTHNYLTREDDAVWSVSVQQAADGTITALANAYTPDQRRCRMSVSHEVESSDYTDGISAVVAAVRGVCEAPLSWDCVTLTDAQGSEWILTPAAWPEIVRVALDCAGVTY